MNNMKLLLVEDHEADQQLCKRAVNDFNDDNTELKVYLEICGNVTEAEEKLRQSDFDGVIIDMKLTDSGEDEGNQVIQKIKESLNRIPVVIMTGTPDVAERNEFPLINIYKKGEITYLQIIEEFRSIYRTGLTKILGGKGVIEKTLADIFTRNLMPALTSSLIKSKGWIQYAEADDSRTETALLRYTLNHLLQHLDNDINCCYPEEMYIYPPINSRINTGSILKKKAPEVSSGEYFTVRINTGIIFKKKAPEKYFIVMNPACDLAERTDGGCNTDRVLLVEIQSLKEVWPHLDMDNLSNKNKQELKKIYKNNKSLYYHWLPETDFYPGGVINFRRVSTHTETEVKNEFDQPKVQVSAPFLKDMISRFSSYYARQGQPDIDIPNIDIEA